jgi:preprotein translocase subunit YajC
MFSRMSWLSMLAADAGVTTKAAAVSPPAASPRSGFMQMLPMLVIIFVIMYLFIFAPQRKKEKKRRQMLDAINKGDKVVTIGGIYGTVSQLKPADVVVDIGGDQKVTLSRGAIARIVTDEGADQETT